MTKNILDPEISLQVLRKPKKISSRTLVLFLCLFGASCSERTTPPAPVSYGYEDSSPSSSSASETRARKASPSLKKPAPIEKEKLIEEEVVPLQKTQDAESEAEDKNLKARDTVDEERALLPPPQPRRKKLSVAQREKELEAQFSTLDPSEDQDGTAAKKSSEIKKPPSRSSAKEEAKNEEESSSFDSQEEALKEKTLSKKEEKSSEPLASEAQGEAKEGTPNFIWPVQGKLVMRFTQEKGKVKNDGINIAAPLNTPIKATETGTVVYEGNEMEGFGNLILIKHPGGWMSAYGHCAKILVKRGEKIKRGQTIALVGKTGSVRTPQVHFQLRKKATVVDPVPYLE